MQDWIYMYSRDYDISQMVQYVTCITLFQVTSKHVITCNLKGFCEVLVQVSGQECNYHCFTFSSFTHSASSKKPFLFSSSPCIGKRSILILSIYIIHLHSKNAPLLVFFREDEALCITLELGAVESQDTRMKN